VRLESYAEWVTYNDIFVEQEYDHAIEVLLRDSTAEAPVVVDLGANVGLFTCRVEDLVRRRQSKVAPRYYCVEGNALTATKLRGNVRQFGARATVVNGLVGRKDGVGHISGGKFHVMNRVGEHGEEAPFVDLESVVAEPCVDLLKCDIEGSELQFAENYAGLLARTRCAIFELHHDLCDTNTCKMLIARAGLVPAGETTGTGSAERQLFVRQ
jgi:FkbM family methyltransferase